MITSPAWPGLLDSDAICHHCCLFIVLAVSARNGSAHAAHVWNAVALFNTIQQENQSPASFFPASIFISSVNTSRCAAAARNPRTEQPTPFFCFVLFFSSLFTFLLQRRPVAAHMARPIMTERLRGPRPKHLAVLYTSPPHRQPVTTSLWVVEGGAAGGAERCPGC